MRAIPTVCFMFAIFASATLAPAVEPPSKQRTGVTRSFGSGTLTTRSDGSTSRTQKFGSGTLTTERDRSGKMITGTTQPLGSGTFSTDKPGGSSSQSSKAVTR